MSHTEDRADLKPAEEFDPNKDSTVESDAAQSEQTRTQVEETARQTESTPPSGDAQGNEQEVLDDDEPVPP
ncbi:hypothetical protein VNI00_015395, partial [Paramarasmius palmivorus]